MKSSLRAFPAALIALLAVACGPVPSGAKRVSQPALVVQQVGDTKLTVRYNRPSARGRMLFGGIVKWDSVWCPGADEGTRLETTRDLAVGGAVLPKGAYTLWMIPRAAADWTLIFSRDADAYHVPYPGAEKDALRIPVRPARGPQTETLSWGFPTATKDGAVLRLAWGEAVVDVPLRPR
ncbi:MAG TPA: DUF2911 domain-containing protein [Longimicrobium sp.]|jgi:hypothetical protein|nr:DUF2911 domain-containing protein [Longimicrobium sp.]